VRYGTWLISLRMSRKANTTTKKTMSALSTAAEW